MHSAMNLEEHRAALTGHCYRMLASPLDADDAVQETMIRAWKSLDRFDGRASLRTWLYRIATNVCLDLLSDRTRRARPMEEVPAGTVHDELTTRPRSHWLEPVPDARVIPTDADPAQVLMLRQSVRLAFVAALQHLPPKQRAVLLLSEVLEWSAAEIAESLETSVAAVNSALQRARATLSSKNVSERQEPLTEAQTKLLTQYLEAFERFDVEALTAMLRDDAVLSMPPFNFWLQGPQNIRSWLLGPGSGCEGSRLVPTQANGLPAFAQYRRAENGLGHKAWALIIIEVSGDRITSWNAFLDTENLFPVFGLPLELPALAA